MTPNPIFSQYNKNLKFGQQCAIEWDLQEQWLHIQRLMRDCPSIADQLLENHKLLVYHELLKSFLEIDNKDDALWREGYE